MKKIIIISSLIIIIGIISFILIISLTQESKEQKIIKSESTDDLIITNNLSFEYYETVNISDIIEVNEGELLNTFLIDTKELGQKEQIIQYKKEDITYETTIMYNVVDTTPPLLNVRSSYTIEVNSENDLIDSIMCADNYDKKPNCEFIGTFDKTKVGTYQVTYKMTDSSNNEVSSNITINVVDKIESSTYTSTPIDLQDIILTHKNENTRIGIDVSKWQETIDWQQVKDSGVEFAILRIGYGWGENKIDPMFEEYYEGAKEVGLDIGLYFYSYADSIKEAEEQADWINETLNKRDIQLPIAFDWEEWGNYNAYNFSITDLNNTALAFLDKIESYGYEGMNYGSANYLRTIWNIDEYKTWLAHYTAETNYEGDYYMWQLTSSGIVPGINGNTDINILYN